MIYICDELEYINDELEKELNTYLSMERFEHANRFTFQNNIIQKKLSYILLRIGLYSEYGIREIPHIEKNEYGKPYLVNRPQIFFNISHCKIGVACGISKKEIGVDIQEFVPYDPQIASMFMSKKELSLTTAGDKDEKFTRIWALKESYGKYKGQGICYKMNDITIQESVRIKRITSKSYLCRDYVLAVTAKEELKLVQLSLLDIKEICTELQMNNT